MKITNIVFKMATTEDVGKIVSLFKLCLGSKGGAPTEKYWNWKHLQNPFGPSPVLLAWDGDVLIGIRAFMKFCFVADSGQVMGYRAVDTATHPDYQGKGIFKKLTLQLIEHLSGEDHRNFIFNTPNEISKTGYLKMGWKVWGKAEVRLIPFFCLQNRSSFAKHQKRLSEYSFGPVAINADKSTYMLRKDYSYFIWRYQDIPLKKYALLEVSKNGNHYLVFYTQRIRNGIIENRICDVLKNNQLTQQLSVQEFWLFSQNLHGHCLTFLQKKPIFASVSIQKFSPTIIYRDFDGYQNDYLFNSFSFNLGELELF